MIAVQKKQNTNRHEISRRTVLRGAGVAMALPWLESLPVWGTTTARTAAAGALPKRLGILFMANGVNPEQWWAKGAGDEFELGPSLEPL